MNDLKPLARQAAVLPDQVRPDSLRRARRLARHLVQHDPAVRQSHRRWRRGLWSYLASADLPTLMTTPAIYSVVFPLFILDAWVVAFQAVCFRVWGIRRVRRSAYFVIDRHKLAYLNGVEKINCFYCSYANGVVAFVREVTARTEQYWCPIKHARSVRDPHVRYERFVEYGDAPGYRRRLDALRRDLERKVSR